MQPLVYAWRTRVGTFQIALGQRGWMLVFDDEVFDGPFRTAQHALDDLAWGHCAWPSCGDTSQFGMSDDIGEWTVARRAR